MAASGVLHPYLPATPMTPEQRKLFDSHFHLVDKMTAFGVRKWGTANASAVRAACMSGLMCAAVRFQIPSAASFTTFAVNTIRWTTRLELRRELGMRDDRRDRKRNKKPSFSASSYRSAGELSAIGVEGLPEYESDAEFVPITTQTPELEYLARERESLARRIVDTAPVKERQLAMLKQRLGMAGDDPDGQTLDAVGKNFRVTRERVRQLVDKTYDSVRQNAARMGVVTALSRD